MPITLTKKEVQKEIAATRLSVDFPRQDEIISSPQYTLRVSAPEGAKNVEICIDQGQWRPCRQAVGYWWYDWSNYGDGEHEIITRIETQGGRKIISEPHEFFVNLQPTPITV